MATTATNTTPTTTATGATTTSSLASSGGKNYLTGTASGINTQALIDAAVAQFTAPATMMQTRITANQTKIAAYQQLQSLISGLTTSMSKLAAPTFSVLANGTTDFQSKTVNVAASNGASAASYLSASASGSAINTSYTVTVDQLAQAQTVASSAMNKSTPLGYSGAFTLSEGSGAVKTITVTANMTLSDIATQINAVASQSGVSASVIKDTSGDYRLVLTGNDTNQAINTSAASGDDVLNLIGLTNGAGGFANVLQAQQPAKVTINGNQVSNDTNDLTDAISGLDIQLTNQTPTGVTLNMSVASDPSAVANDIDSFISAYNSLRDFVVANQKVNADGTVDASEPLFADSLLSGASAMLNSIISTPAGSATGAYQTLGDLGITLDASNKLTISNPTTLTSALKNNLAQVASMFQTSFTPSDPGLKLIRNTTLQAFDFNLDVKVNPDGTLASASVNGDASMFTISGGSIVGAAGTPYQGLTFAYVANGDTTIHVSLQPGLANQLNTFATTYASTTSSTALIQSAINQLSSQDDDWNTRIATIQQQAASYQQQLITKYAKMEQRVNAAQLVQAQLKAILDSYNKQ